LISLEQRRRAPDSFFSEEENFLIAYAKLLGCV